nr:nucleotide pyrophosphatase/phosphodiesterase family protein [Nesterenkonia lacusekhoensis]
MTLPEAPDYDGAHLRRILPSVGASLGLSSSDASGECFQNRLGLPEANIAVVLMVDGLGDEQLARHTGHARFLASRWRKPATGRVLDAGVPSTTSASLTSLGTGRTPGEHGLTGYNVYAEDLDRVVNMLGGWDPEVDPGSWQPHSSLLGRAEGSGAAVVTISRPQFQDSPLTQAALSGGEFLGAKHMDARFRLAEDWISGHRPRKGQVRQGAPTPLMVYLYVDELDKTGHKHGVDSAEWIRMLELLDAEAERFCASLSALYGSQALVLMTADHGMIDIAPENRIDLQALEQQEQDELLGAVEHVAGEPRFLHLHTVEGREAEVRETWQRAFGDQAWVVQKQEALDAGWFGPVEDRVLSRIGDVLVAVHGPIALFHTAESGKAPLSMVGQHGSLTDAERKIPLLSLSGQDIRPD